MKDKKKQLTRTILIFIMMVAVFCIDNMQTSFAGEIVEPTTAKLSINSVPKSFEAYSINQNNYFKLRDLAVMLKEDPKQFDVNWDAQKKGIVLKKNQIYSGNSEDTKENKGKVKIAKLNNYPIFVDGDQAHFIAYNIDGNNYFKLRDIMELLDISVNWNEKTQAIAIDTSKPYIAVKTLPLSGLLICVDAGHGTYGKPIQEPVYPNATEKKRGYSTGTAGSQYSEAQVNLAVSFMLKEKLEAQGAKIMMTRQGTASPGTNVMRAQMANNAGANMVIRIHCDGSTNRSRTGMSMLVPSSKHVSDKVAKTSYSMGECVLNNTLRATGAVNGGVVVREDLSGFNWSTVPTILIEMGFMTNPADDKKLSTWEYQQKLSNGITAGVVEYFEKNRIAALPQKNISETGKRVDAYMAKKSKLSQDEALWRIKMNMDKPEFRGAKTLTNGELNDIGVVVNKRNGVPDNYSPSDLVQITEGVYLRLEAKKAFDNMTAEAKKQNLTIIPISGFRQIESQGEIYNGYLKSDSLANVEMYCARAGFSEHHTGLAVDIEGSNGSKENFKASREFMWIAENAYQYGWIIRYLPGVSDITGYKDRPYHLRYVGVEIAEKMKTQGIKTLEEYVGRNIL